MYAHIHKEYDDEVSSAMSNVFYRCKSLFRHSFIHLQRSIYYKLHFLPILPLTSFEPPSTYHRDLYQSFPPYLIYQHKLFPSHNQRTILQIYVNQLFVQMMSGFATILLVGRIRKVRYHFSLHPNWVYHQPNPRSLTQFVF